MNKSLLLGALFALAVSGPLAAAAQEAPGSPAPAPPSNTTRTATAISPSAPNNGASFSQLMSALNRSRSEAVAVAALRGLRTNDVHIVKVQSMPDADTAALTAAMTKNAAQLTALRNALARIPLTATTDSHTLTLAEFLSDNRMSINQVVAADASNGSLTVFVQ
jgi:hypothetical protein